MSRRTTKQRRAAQRRKAWVDAHRARSWSYVGNLVCWAPGALERFQRIFQ